MEEEQVITELTKIINDVKISEDGGHLYGWVTNFPKFEEDYRILTGVSYVTRSSVTP